MDWGLPVQILAGVCLAACCGLRAFLPLFVLSLTVRLQLSQWLLGRPLEMHPSFEWLASTPALIVLGTAVVIELLADKVPAVDNLLDVLQTLVRPLAGAVAVAAVLTGWPPWAAAAAGLLVGGSVAGGVHLGKAKIRLLSTVSTAGLASPVLSLIEDLLALCGSILAVLFALLALVLILAGFLATWVLFRRFSKRAGKLQQDLEIH